MRYYISDLHFYHENLNYQMDHRGFSNAAEMNAHMIRQWNSKIRDRDEVVVLGRFISRFRGGNQPDSESAEKGGSA